MFLLSLYAKNTYRLLVPLDGGREEGGRGRGEEVLHSITGNITCDRKIGGNLDTHVSIYPERSLFNANSSLHMLYIDK